MRYAYSKKIEKRRALRLGFVNTRYLVEIHKIRTDGGVRRMVGLVETKRGRRVGDP